MSSEDKITLIPRSDILIDGQHAPAGVAIETAARTATALLQGGFADIVKNPPARTRPNEAAHNMAADTVRRETASNPPTAVETAAATAPAPAKPKAQKRTAPKAP